MRRSIRHELSPLTDPFRWPSATGFRFVTLLLAVAGASLALIDYIVLWKYGLTYFRMFQKCQLYFEYGTAELSRCTSPVQIIRVGLDLTYLSAVLLIAGGLWWFYPRLIVRRRHLVVLPVDVTLQTSLAELVHTSGLRRTPQWWLEPGNLQCSGMAFGHPKRRMVALSAGLLVIRNRSPDRFRAIVLHELAHIRNQDLDLSFGGVALSRIFIFAVMVPFVIAAIDNILKFGTSIASIQYIIRGGLTLLIVALLRNSVLRTRELFADARAMQQGATALPDLVAAMSSDEGWRTRTGMHPTAAERLATLGDSTRLSGRELAAAFGSSLAAGLGITATIPLVQSLLSPFDPVLLNLTHGELASLVTSVIFLVPAMLSTMAAIWRSSTVAGVHSQHVQIVWPNALAVAAGVVVGMELSPLTSIQESPTSVGELAVLLILMVTNILITAVGVALLLTFVVRVGRKSASDHVDQRRRFYWIFLTLAAFASARWMALAISSYTMTRNNIALHLDLPTLLGGGLTLIIASAIFVVDRVLVVLGAALIMLVFVKWYQHRKTNIKSNLNIN